MEDEVACMFQGGGGLEGRNVSPLRQCLYKYIHWMLFEFKSGDWKAQIQQNNVFMQCQLRDTTRHLKTGSENNRHVCAGTVL